MQTPDWEALLDGTTPGPWEWHGDQDPDMRFIHDEEGRMCMTVEPVGSAYRDADPVLAAHAPAAVAEVVRQAARIEQLDAELRAQAAQIEQVREARSMINRIIVAAEGGVDLGDPATLAKSIVNKLNDALGDTDD